MKDIKEYILEQNNNIPIFDPKESPILSDGRKLSGAIYQKEMKITAHAESYEEALNMIEHDCTKDDKLYFIRWNKFKKAWENATVTFYWKRGSGNNFLISSEGDTKTKERLEKDFNNKDYVLVVVGEEQ